MPWSIKIGICKSGFLSDLLQNLLIVANNIILTSLINLFILSDFFRTDRIKFVSQFFMAIPQSNQKINRNWHASKTSTIHSVVCVEHCLMHGQHTSYVGYIDTMPFARANLENIFQMHSDFINL